MEDKGVGFTAEKVMDSVFEYAKVTVMIQSYAKDKYYAKTTRKPYGPKDKKCNWRRAAAAATSSTLK